MLLHSLFSAFPVLVLTWYLYYQIQENMLLFEVIFNAVKAVHKAESKRWVVDYKKPIGWFVCLISLHRDYNQLEAMLKASQLLLLRLTSKLPSAKLHCINILKLGLSVLLYSANNLSSLCATDNEIEKASSVCDLTFKKMFSCLEDWIKRNFGKTFGSPDSKSFACEEEELEVWYMNN